MNYKKWSIEEGDYQRDSESTSSFEKKAKRKEYVKNFFKVAMFLAIIAVLAFLVTI